MNGLNHLPDSARVWIYQASAPLSDDHRTSIRAAIESFIAQWAAHGAALTAGFDILHDRFVVIAVDESQQAATGCSIDKSVQVMLDLEQQLGLTFTDRKTIAYLQDNQITTAPMHEFWALRKAGRVTADTLVFDNLVKTLGELQDQWQKPFSESWHQTMWN